MKKILLATLLFITAFFSTGYVKANVEVSGYVNPDGCGATLVLVVHPDTINYPTARQYWIRRTVTGTGVGCDGGMHTPVNDTILINGIKGFNSFEVYEVSVAPYPSIPNAPGWICGGFYFNPCLDWYGTTPMQIVIGTQPLTMSSYNIDVYQTTGSYHCEKGGFYFSKKYNECFRPFDPHIMKGSLHVNCVANPDNNRVYDFDVTPSPCGTSDYSRIVDNLEPGSYNVVFDNDLGEHYDTTLFFPFPDPTPINCTASAHEDMSEHENSDGPGCDGYAQFFFNDNLPCGTNDRVQLHYWRTDILDTVGEDYNAGQFYNSQSGEYELWGFGVPPGTYHITFDHDVCHTESNFVISAAPLPPCSATAEISSVTNPNCFGCTNGQVELHIHDFPNPDFCTPTDIFYSQPGTDINGTADCYGSNCSVNLYNLQPGPVQITVQYYNTCFLQLDTILFASPNPPTSGVHDVRINNSIGKLLYVPFEGVRVQAFASGNPTTVVEEVFTDANGNFTFTQLDSFSFYTLKYYYHDNNDQPGDSVLYTYTGFKYGEDFLPVVNLPYTMFKQTRQQIDAIRTKGNYEIQYLLGFLNYTSTSPRKLIDVNSIESLINGWRNIDQYNDEIKDVTDNLGRVYIAIYAADQFSNDAYDLSKVPPKAASGMLIALVEMTAIADFLEKAGEVGKTTKTPEGVSIFKFIDKAKQSVAGFALKEAESMLSKDLETATDPDVKILLGGLIKIIKSASLVVKEKTGGTVDFYKDFIKDVINNQVFKYLYESAITNIQEEVDKTYRKASILGPPDGTFEQAARKVLVPDGSSLVNAGHQKTAQTLDLCGTFLSNAESVDMILAAGSAVTDVANAVPGANLTFINTLKGFMGLFNLFQIGNDGLALLYSYSRYGDNLVEQITANTYAFSPPAPAPHMLMPFASQQNGVPNTMLIDNLKAELQAYNDKLDTVMALVLLNQNDLAAQKANELMDLDSLLNHTLNSTTNRIDAIAVNASGAISSFDSLQHLFYNQRNTSSKQRAQIALGLSLWFLDTTAIQFTDTLQDIASHIKTANTSTGDIFEQLETVTAGVSIPVRVSVIDIDAPHEVLKGSVSQINVSYQNYGTDTARNTYVIIQTENGYTTTDNLIVIIDTVFDADTIVSIDTIVNTRGIFIGDIAPGGRGVLAFDITTPNQDTFCVYTINLKNTNGRGDFESDYLLIPRPKTYYADADEDGYGDINRDSLSFTPPAGYTLNSNDCNDANPAIHPNAPEICDGIDNDCDGLNDLVKGTALNLDGNDDFISLPDLLNGESQFTIAFWINTTENRSDATFWNRPTMFGVVNPGAPDGDIGITTDNGYIGMWSGLCTCGDQEMLSSKSINDSTWHYITLTADGSTLTLYVDGNSVGTLSADQGINSASGLNLGAARWNNASFFHQGIYDGLSLWNVAKTQTEIQEGMNILVTSLQPDLAATYAFNNNLVTGGGNNAGKTIVVDNSGHAHNGTLNNLTLNGQTSNWVNGIVKDKSLSRVYYVDADADGYGNPALHLELCSPLQGMVTDNTDCNDANASVHPNAPEICDGLDNDCDGLVDINALSGLQLYLPFSGNANDASGHNHNGSGVSLTLNADRLGETDSAYYFNGSNSLVLVADHTDLRPRNFTLSAWYNLASVPSGVRHLVGKSLCAGWANSYAVYFIDGTLFVGWADGPESMTQLSYPLPALGQWHHVALTFDDDSNTAKVFIDNILQTVYSTDMTIAYDGNPLTIGMDLENCALDFPLDGKIDDVSLFNRALDETEINTLYTATPLQPLTFTYYADVDGDGYGNAAISQVVSSCPPPAGFVLNNTDCNDSNPGVHDVKRWFRDADSDGYGVAGTDSFTCSTPVGYASDSTDCDDTNPNINLFAPEVCDGIDNNCNGLIDDDDPGAVDKIQWYIDSDNDGYGENTFGPLSCQQPPHCAALQGDCDDSNPNIHPGATEICNGIDDNCDGLVDDADPAIDSASMPMWYADEDGDGYGDPNVTKRACAQPNSPFQFVANNNDCNDFNPEQHPGAQEICNGIDDDCDGLIDDDDPSTLVSSKSTWYADADGDGYGNAAVTVLACNQPAGYVANNRDCNDANSAVHPGVSEICNGLDDDCNGAADDNDPLVIGQQRYYFDDDDDGFGTGTFTILACFKPSHMSLNNLDCNDLSASVYPGAPEICGNGIDDNCDGLIDEGCLTISATVLNTICTGTSNGSVNISPAGGTQPYFFHWSNGATTEDISLLTAGNYSVTLTDAFGSSASASFIVGTTVPSAKPATPGVITGAVTVCRNQTYTYSVANVTNAASYTWTVPSTLATLVSGQGTTQISVLFLSNYIATNNIKVTASNCLGTSAAKTLAVAPIPVPATPGTISGTAGICPGTYTYTIAPVTNASTYFWSTPANASLLSGQGTTSATIQFGNVYTTGSLSVAAINCNGSSAAKNVTVAIMAKATTPLAITGATAVCAGVFTYSISPVANASSYTWVAPNNASVVSGQGTTSASIQFTGSYNTGTVGVSASNCGGTSTTRILTVKKAAVPAVPAAISGTTAICPGTYTYSISPVTNAVSYNWTAPANASIVSGQGTTSVSVQFNSPYTTGALSVAALNCAGSSAAKTLTVALRTKPNSPGTITGAPAVCAGTYSYSVAPAINATSYNWTTPAHASITSGQGTTAITVNIETGFTTGTISVTAVNCGGASLSRTLALVTTPAAPAGITGQTTSICGVTTGIPYSVAPIEGASGYQWLVTGGTIASGQGTAAITVDFPATFTSATVKVREITACSSTGALKSITATQATARPGAITGPASSCPTLSNTYSIAGVTGATSYIWTPPTDWVITDGQGTTAITLTTGTVGGNLKVQASNSCATTTAISRPLNISSGCRLAGTADENMEEAELIQDGKMSLRIYPNPSNGDFFIELSGIDEAEPLQVDLYNVNGQSVYNIDKLMLNNDSPFMIESAKILSKGLYLLRVHNDSINFEKKVMISK